MIRYWTQDLCDSNNIKDLVKKLHPPFLRFSFESLAGLYAGLYGTLTDLKRLSKKIHK